MALSTPKSHQRMEMNGTEISIYELTPCMTLVQVSLVHDEQKSNATL